MFNRRFWRTASAVLLLSATVAASPACAAPRGRLYVRVGPPAPIIETRIVAPGPGYVWVPGYHRWSGSPTSGCQAAGIGRHAYVPGGCQADGSTREGAAGISWKDIGDKRHQSSVLLTCGIMFV